MSRDARRFGLATAALAAFVAASSTSCAARPTLPETLHHFRVGDDATVVAHCESEAARWRAANPDQTTELPGALAAVEEALGDDGLLSDEAPDVALTPEGRDDLARQLREGGLEAGGGPGVALRRLAADLLSDAPVRIIRAAEQVAELGLRRLVPHLVANVYSDRPLRGTPGPLGRFSLGVRMLAVKTWCVRAVRRMLDAP